MIKRLSDCDVAVVLQVEEVSRVMGQELGFPDHTFSLHGSYKVTTSTGSVNN